ncbi:gas vesicle synthesis-like protein [Streptomyces collinus Tu 365]|uniref:Gas vesicle synthesis-like protein n=1 Tax=Streptomyces collinus (strain DSM 40733 / Tue 365) TaxID=1214242 RepID=S5VEP6_STRC3|nr:gas vesicle synthesis-like protein [Streptomyces collinus Tu 365]AGS73794.1 gas vesicle synthesis-like protein [Streptomyces collinus Tu 365]
MSGFPTTGTTGPSSTTRNSAPSSPRCSRSRIVIAGIDTYLRFAEACNRLDPESGPRKPASLPQLAYLAASPPSTASPAVVLHGRAAAMGLYIPSWLTAAKTAHRPSKARETRGSSQTRFAMAARWMPWLPRGRCPRSLGERGRGGGVRITARPRSPRSP